MKRNVIEINKLLQVHLTNNDEEVIGVEALINKYDTSLSQYLLKIAIKPTLSDKQIQEYYKNYQIIKYFKQIYD